MRLFQTICHEKVVELKMRQVIEVVKKYKKDSCWLNKDLLLSTVSKRL